MQIQIVSSSPQATETLAEQLGKRLVGGELLELVSDLGGGKTTFVRGLARGMGSPDIVTSPSFALANQYIAGKLTLHHFDFYRLSDPSIMQHELREVIDDPFAVVVVEWPEIVSDIFDIPHPVISLRHSGETERDIDVDSPDQYAYLFKNEAQ